jgi:hypothetical protein
MPYITEIKKEGDLNIAMQTFAATCQANSAALGLTPPNIVEINGMSTNFTGSLTGLATSKAATKLAQQNKDTTLKASKATLSKWAKTFRANPAVSDALLDQLQLPHHKTPGTKTPPTTPTDLVGDADIQGLVSLKWRANGNRSGTQYVVESQPGPDAEWAIIGSTTKTKTTFQAVAGNYIAFRVTARRDDQDSQPTLPIVLWSNGAPQAGLSVAA